MPDDPLKGPRPPQPSYDDAMSWLESRDGTVAPQGDHDQEPEQESAEDPLEAQEQEAQEEVSEPDEAQAEDEGFEWTKRPDGRWLLKDRKLGNETVDEEALVSFARKGRHATLQRQRDAEEHRKRMEELERREARLESALQIQEYFEDPQNGREVMEIARRIQRGERALPGYVPEESTGNEEYQRYLAEDGVGAETGAQAQLPPQVIQLLDGLTQEVQALRSERDQEKAAEQRKRVEEVGKTIRTRVDNAVAESKPLKLLQEELARAGLGSILGDLSLLVANRRGYESPEEVVQGLRPIEQAVGAAMKRVQRALLQGASERNERHMTLSPNAGPPVTAPAMTREEAEKRREQTALGRGSRGGAMDFLDAIIRKRASGVIEK